MIFRVREDLKINQGEVNYVRKDLSFDFKPIYDADYSILIGYVSLNFDSETRRACQVWGCNPINTWVNKGLIKPKSIRGDLLLDDEIEAGDNIRLIEVGVWLTYFDKSTGWVCIGNDKVDNNDIAVEFASNTIAVINKNSLKALWLNPKFIE